MPIKNFIFIFIGLSMTGFAAQDTVCYEYPSDSYRIINTKSLAVKDPKTKEVDYKDLNTQLDSRKYRLILAGSKSAGKLHTHYFFLLDRKSGTVIDFQTSECPSPQPNPERLYCYGECDSGIYSIEKEGQINFKTDGITIGETIDAPEGIWEIKPAQNADLPKPTTITCPGSISSRDLAPNKDNQPYIDAEIKSLVKPIRYVCYSAKRISDKEKKPIYEGCRFTRDQCDGYYPGWKQFGHYPSEEATMQAFKRCRHSTPKPGK